MIQRWLSSILIRNCILVHDKSLWMSLPPFPDTIQFPTRTAFIWLNDWDLLGPSYWPSTYQDEGHVVRVDLVFSFLLCGIIHEYSQMANANQNQNMRMYYRVFGQKINPTLCSSHSVEILAQTGSCMQCAVKMYWRNLGALSSIYFSFISWWPIHLITSESMKKQDARFPYLSLGILNFGWSYLSSQGNHWADLRHTRAQRRAKRQVASQK